MCKVVIGQMGEHEIDTNTQGKELGKNPTPIKRIVKVLQFNLDVKKLLNRDPSKNLDELCCMLELAPTTSLTSQKMSRRGTNGATSPCSSTYKSVSVQPLIHQNHQAIHYSRALSITLSHAIFDIRVLIGPANIYGRDHE
jgi:hypothetical protein